MRVCAQAKVEFSIYRLFATADSPNKVVIPFDKQIKVCGGRPTACRIGFTGLVQSGIAPLPSADCLGSALARSQLSRRPPGSSRRRLLTGEQRSPVTHFSCLRVAGAMQSCCPRAQAMRVDIFTQIFYTPALIRVGKTKRKRHARETLRSINNRSVLLFAVARAASPGMVSPKELRGSRASDGD